MTDVTGLEVCMRVWIAVLVGALAGCSEAGGSKGSPEPVPEAAPLKISFEPGDLMSSVRGTPFVARVFGDVRVDDSTLETLRDKISLSGDDGSVVPTTVEIGQESLDNSKWRELTITPNTELAAMWYELSVDLTGSEVTPFRTMLPLGDGAFGIRLHPDARPVLRRLSFCPAADDSAPPLAIVEFSEPINYVADAEGIAGNVPMKVVVDGVECSLLQTTFEAHDGFNPHFEYGCVSARANGTVSVELKRDLVTRTGAKATLPGSSADASSIVFGFDQAFDLGDGCTSWHMP